MDLNDWRATIARATWLTHLISADVSSKYISRRRRRRYYSYCCSNTTKGDGSGMEVVVVALLVVIVIGLEREEVQE